MHLRRIDTFCANRGIAVHVLGILAWAVICTSPLYMRTFMVLADSTLFDAFCWGFLGVALAVAVVSEVIAWRGRTITKRGLP